MKKLKEILLIDDSRGTNSLNERLLKRMEVVDEISIALNGKQALDHLFTKNKNGIYPEPDLILLDINMPVMDGFQFLEEYEKRIKASRIIVMLTTSISESDQNKANNFSSIMSYIFKPLTKEKITELISSL